MFHVIDFPTRTTKISSSTDNILIDYRRVNSFEVFPLINGVSDHAVQYLVLNDIFDSHKSNKLSIKKRIIIKVAVACLIDVLGNESWD
jgi:hypothetical protein